MIGRLWGRPSRASLEPAVWCRPRRAHGGARGRAVARSIGLALLATGGAVASAQNAPAPAAAPAATDTAAAAAPATPTPAPSGSAAAASASKGAVMGYAYKTSGSSALASPSGTPHHRHLLPHHANEAVATFTGFEMLADGGSRLFVQLSRQVDVGQEKGETAAAASPRKGKKARAAAKSDVVARLKFVLKGTEVVNPMNEGALVTVHFNTPVLRARLVPAGHDLDLMVELRSDVTPQMKIVPAKDNGAMLQIDFPQGAYLPAGASEPAPATQDPARAPAPAALPPTAGGPQRGMQPAGANDSMESK